MSALAPTCRRAFFGACGATIVSTALGCWGRDRAERLRRPRVALGFLRQTDAASLLVGEALGIYARRGLAPTFERGQSPLDLATKLLSGGLLAAQLPASWPLAAAGAAMGAPGLSAPPGALVTLMALSENGGAITLGRDLCRGVRFLDLDGLRDSLARHGERTPVTLAVPAVGGTDDLSLRYLLGAAGVPAARVQIVAAAPEQMLADLREERIVGFAAPDPWPALAVKEDIGFTFATAQDIWRAMPRSALVTTPRMLEERHSDLKELVRAVLEASLWLDVPANRAGPLLGDTLARQSFLDIDSTPIRARLGSVYDLGCRMGERDFEDDRLFFHAAGHVNLPRRADALLFAALLARFAITPGLLGSDAIAATIRDDVYREVAREAGVSLPTDMKPLVITLDAVRFDPSAPSAWPGLWPSG